MLIRSALTSEVVLGQANFGFALAFEMVVVVAVVMALYSWLIGRTSRAALVTRARTWGLLRWSLLLAFTAFFLLPLMALLDFSTSCATGGGPANSGGRSPRTRR